MEARADIAGRRLHPSTTAARDRFRRARLHCARRFPTGPPPLVRRQIPRQRRSRPDRRSAAQAGDTDAAEEDVVTESVRGRSDIWRLTVVSQGGAASGDLSLDARKGRQLRGEPIPSVRREQNRIAAVEIRRRRRAQRRSRIDLEEDAGQRCRAARDASIDAATSRRCHIWRLRLTLRTRPCHGRRGARATQGDQSRWRGRCSLGILGPITLDSLRTCDWRHGLQPASAPRAALMIATSR